MACTQQLFRRPNLHSPSPPLIPYPPVKDLDSIGPCAATPINFWQARIVKINMAELRQVAHCFSAPNHHHFLKSVVLIHLWP